MPPAFRKPGKVGQSLICVGVGIALMILLRALSHDPVAQVPGGVYFAGLIPLLTGIALLVYSYLLAPNE